ncbi:MAG: hypothetical protein IPP73_02960 [Chitinophagaceae bacterium]|nr:hypothetical protein [Chitinophagaceae bacterium]
MMKFTNLILFVFLWNGLAAQPQAGAQEIQPVDSLYIEQLFATAGRSWKSGDTATALRIFNEARGKARKNGLRLQEARAFVQIGDLYFGYETYSRAFGNYTQARAILEDTPDDFLSTQITISLAKSQYHRGNYRLAVNNFVEAIPMARKIKRPDMESEAMEYLGLLYNSFQGYNEGTAYYVRSLEIKKNIGDESGAVRVSEILGETFYRKKMYDSALYFSVMASSMAKGLGLTTESYMAEINRAMSLIRLRRWEEAEKILNGLSGTIYTNQDMNRRIRYEICLGNLWLSQNDSVTGAKYYDKAKKTAKESTFPEMNALVYRNMAESYYEIRDYKRAYENFTIQMNYISQLYAGRNLTNLGSLENIMSANLTRDEVKVLQLQNELKQNQLMKELLMREGLERENALMDAVLLKEKSLAEALEGENKARKKELEKETSLKTALNRENQLKEIQLQKERNTRLVLVTGAVLLLLSVITILALYRKQHKKSMVIMKQSEDMQVLMKEIHHRVKNNMQIVSSLLDLQSISIRDNQAAEAVKEGRNRVQSMALIHQNLYAEDNLKGIKTRAYIGNLLQNLCDSYNISQDKVKISTDIEDLNLDVDTMIPMGLILNELLTNSFKYAFSGNRNGELNILLKREEAGLHLMVKDNGPGFPEGLDTKNTRSFGLRMVRAFAQKLKAVPEFTNEKGAKVSLYITKYSLA